MNLVMLFAKGFDEMDGFSWVLLAIVVVAILGRMVYRLNLLERNPEAYKTLMEEEERKKQQRTGMFLKGAGFLARRWFK
jgi:hypothetical protein